MVGEQMGEDGKAVLPWPPPGCGLYAGVRGVKGGEGERLPGRRMDGRNLRSRSRRGGVMIELRPMAELVGEIRGVGESVAGASWDRRARWKDDLRRFRRRSQSKAKHTRAISASVEHTATAAISCPDKLLPDVVDAPAVATPAVVVVGVSDVDPGGTATGIFPGCVVVAVGTVLVDPSGVSILDCGD